MEDDHRPFVIERAGRKGRIRLNADARWWAKQHGMTDREMASYLLQRDEQGDAQGMIGGESESGDTTTPTDEDFLPNVIVDDRTFSGEPSELVEDRRAEPEFVGDTTMNRIWGKVPPVAPNAQTYGPNPLANALGFRDVGARP